MAQIKASVVVEHPTEGVSTIKFDTIEDARKYANDVNSSPDMRAMVQRE